MEKRVKSTKNRIIQNLVILLAAVAVFLGATFFVWETAVYTVRHLAVVSTEMEGKTPTHTANGPQTWLPSETEAYDNAKAARAELVAKSDIAKFMFDCGGSTTGKIVRVIVCIVVVTIDVIAFMYAFTSAKCIFRSSRRLIKWKIREIEEKRTTSQSSKKKDGNIQRAIEHA